MTQQTKEMLNKRFNDFGIAMLYDRYLLSNETPNDLFERVANAYADDNNHKERIIDYMKKCWFMPATPVLSNGGVKRGLPISCFLNECEDSLASIDDLWHENTYLASRGGGIGSYWGNVRSIGEKISSNGTTSGIIPFIKVMDSLTLAISQGSLRRGNAAVYLPIEHPEIEEFIDIRRPTGGDANRRCLNIHHAVVISDEFMKAVEEGGKWELKSPATGELMHSVQARDLWIKILTSRIETGEPYILYKDNVQKYSPKTYKYFNIESKTSNLCSEITLATGKDHLGNERTAVCCLSSVNLEYFDEWKDNEQFIEDVMRFLDNVLDDFMQRAPTQMQKATYAAYRERSVGLGVMGFHSYLQKNNIPLESPIAKGFNLKCFQWLKEVADKVSKKLAVEKGPCVDNFEMIVRELLKEGKIAMDETLLNDIDFLYQDYLAFLKSDQSEFKFSMHTAVKEEVMKNGERLTHKLAVAPTASISEICGGCSPGIEPFIANTFNKKNLTGVGSMRNKYLKQLLASKGKDNEDVWQEIISNEGSVQGLEFLSEQEKAVFKTAFEIDQASLIELAADRTPYICQAQSLNIFLSSSVSRSLLHKIHFVGWKKGLKSFYYLRSQSIGRGEKISKMSEKMQHSFQKLEQDECLACQ
jgi:ribonucleoside-diphosphate reductase alpha chain